MKTIITAAALIIMSAHAMAQKPTYDTLRDADNGALVYKGTITLNGLDAEPSFGWMRKGAADYKPEAKDITYLKDNLGKYHIVLFMGTWCEDSQNLVPELYKILKDANYPADKVTAYGVDRSKTTGFQIEEKYKVLFVPSIIIMDGDRELGRITESVNKSVEADMVAILKKG